MEDGLPNRAVGCIIQDSRGFIWISTFGGVARYDGQRFKIYNKAENGLSNDMVHWMLEDAAGKIWLIHMDTYGPFSNIGAIDILDPVTDRAIPIEQYIKIKPPLPLKNFNITGLRYQQEETSLAKVKKGTLFFGTRNPGGWISWHPDEGWKQVVTPSLSQLELRLITPQGGVIGRNLNNDLTDQIAEFDITGKLLRLHKGTNGNNLHTMFGGSLNGKSVYAVQMDNTLGYPIYWEITAGAEKKKLQVSIPDTKNPLNEQLLLLELEKDALWLNERQVFNKRGDKLLNLLEQFPAYNNRYIGTYLRDRNGGIWLGTDFGVELIEIQKDHFRRYLYSEKALEGRGIACRGIVQKDGRFWVNTEGASGGLCGVMQQTGNLFMEQKNGTGYGLAFDNDNKLWNINMQYGSSGGGLEQVDPITGKLIESVELNTDLAFVIFPASPSQLWVSLNRGIVFFNTVSKRISSPVTSRFPEFEKANIVHIGRSHAGDIWVCSSNGLYRMTADGQITAHYWTGGEGKFKMPVDNFNHFYEDADGIFWLATGGSGLLRWNQKTGEKQLFARKAGLLNNVLYAVYEDGHEHLWIPTDLGIAQFDKKSLTVRRTWLPKDGVGQNEFNRTSHCRGEDSTLYFGGLNGVTAFNPNDFYQPAGSSFSGNDAKARLVLSDFKLFSGSSATLENRTAELLASGVDSSGTDGEITMQPSDRYFQLEFALLDYFSPKSVTYSYKLEAVDADWNTLSEPLLRMSALPSGRHRLLIRAQSADGTWAGNELHFKLYVLPPLYLRWWFLLMAGIGLAAAIYYVYSFQLRKSLAAKETQRLVQIDAFKTRFFTNISHEFRTPLTVILGMSNRLKGSAGSRDEKEVEQTAEIIERNSQQLLILVNQLLDLSKLESGKLQLSSTNGDIVGFLHYQLESLRSYAALRNITLDFNSNLHQLPMAFDHDKIQAILVNLLSNAIKFTPQGGKVGLELQIDSPSKAVPEKIFFTVSDNGMGIPEADLSRIFDRFYQVDDSMTRKSDGTGIGLALVQELVKLMQGTITVESTVGVGTSFKVGLPFTPVQTALPTYEPSVEITKAMPQTNTDQLLEPDEDGRPLLLIVEDNPDVRSYIKQCVQNDHRVMTAENGVEGVAKAKEWVPDIIISDVMMPEMDGLTLCHTLKNDEVTSHIPIVLLTARADLESRISGLTRGADAYLAKPFEPAELKAHLENLVTIRRRMQQRYAAMAALLPAGPQQEDVQIEDAFLAKIRLAVEAHLDDADYEITQLCTEIGMSRSQLFRKVKALTDASPSILIRTIRLQNAAEFLRNKELTIAEVAYMSGFSTPAYFSTMFLEQYGKTPTEWRAAAE